MSLFDQIFGDWLNGENKKHLLALFVVVKFFVVLGIVGFLVWTLRRNAAKQDKETSKLLDELEQEEQPEENSTWEKDADWWKK